jgi:hypothetical protein
VNHLGKGPSHDTHSRCIPQCAKTNENPESSRVSTPTWWTPPNSSSKETQDEDPEQPEDIIIPRFSSSLAYTSLSRSFRTIADIFLAFQMRGRHEIQNLTTQILVTTRHFMATLYTALNICTPDFQFSTCLLSILHLRYTAISQLTSISVHYRPQLRV